jgi:hypothetical protein
VYTHFVSHFKTRDVERPGVENLLFKTLSAGARRSLIQPFFRSGGQGRDMGLRQLQ